eukprot:NODE_266_length_11332_cov_0.554705.p4 type:complete len:377 gc:universal NODE_266_length_11332_cov_0.554705:3048-4178(+)
MEPNSTDILPQTDELSVFLPPNQQMLQQAQHKGYTRLEIEDFMKNLFDTKLTEMTFKSHEVPRKKGGTYLYLVGHCRGFTIIPSQENNKCTKRYCKMEMRATRSPDNHLFYFNLKDFQNNDLFHNHSFSNYSVIFKKKTLQADYPQVLKFIVDSKSAYLTVKPISRMINLTFNIVCSRNLINNIKADYYNLEELLVASHEVIDYEMVYTNNGPNEQNIQNLKFLFIYFKKASDTINIPSPVVFDSNFNITGISGLKLIIFSAKNNMGKAVNLAVVYIYSENMDYIKDVLDMFIQYYPHPIVSFMTDRDSAYLATLKTHFPHIPHMYCIWHIMQNIRIQWTSISQIHRERIANYIQSIANIRMQEVLSIHLECPTNH